MHQSLLVLVVGLALAATAPVQMLPAVAPAATEGEVAFAAPPTPPPDNQTAACALPCYIVGDRWPFRTCQAECNPDVCNRGYGVYQTREVCCSPGVAFPDGCSTRPSECWVVESFALQTCVRDDRKCLQGYGVYPSEAACCAPTAAFPNGCGNVTKAPEPCWVVDTYWPARQCRQSRTLCGPESGVQQWASEEACCALGAAFGEGCSEYIPVTPCWLAAEPQYPNRTCRQSNDVALCNRGWGVYQNASVCCAPGAAFSDGCTLSPAPGAVPDAVPVAPAPTPAAAPLQPAVTTQPPVTAAPTPATPLPAVAAAAPAATAAPAASAAPAATAAPTVAAPVNQSQPFIAVTTTPLTNETVVVPAGK